ncbi:MAG: type II toxin-antitoxin system HicB family antitoxin [Salinivirgaceae bacterium]|nr:type II toxin-antitoxin system HicB family antitoxin [Salinivirgaceae bacterium]
MKRLNVVLERTDTGYSAYSNEIPGCAATGKTYDETKKNIVDAIDSHLELLKEFNEEIPEVLQSDYELSFKLDSITFFEWLDGIMTKAGISRISGINQSLISQYAMGIKNPSQKQLLKIEKAIHKFGADLQAFSF